MKMVVVTSIKVVIGARMYSRTGRGESTSLIMASEKDSRDTTSDNAV